MGASKYAYAEATWTQTLPDWIASNIRALEFMNGATHYLDSNEAGVVG
jgi:transposase